MRKNENINQNSFIKWIRTSPIMKTLVAAIPMTWHGIVIGFYGIQSGFTDANGITSKGKTVTLIVYLFVILYTLTINVFDRIRIKQEQDYASISKFVLEKTLVLYDDKLENQKDTFFNQAITNTSFTYDVVKRINNVLKELIRCVEYSSELNPDNISAALFYTFNKKKGHWYLIERNYCDAFDGKKRDAVMHPESFAKFLSEYSRDFYLINDKYKDGVKHKIKGTVSPIYKLNKRDNEDFQQTKKWGSIAGIKFKIKNKKTVYIQAMLFVSTYNGKLDNSKFGGNKSFVEKSLSEIILPYFQMNLQAELMHLYREDSQKNKQH